MNAVVEIIATPDAVGTALAEVTKTNQTLTALAERGRELAESYRGVAFDVSTVKGMAEACAARRALREEARYPMQKLQDAGSKMLGDMQRQFNARAKELIAEVASAEAPIHDQIEAEEKCKELEKAKREQAEREAAAWVQAKIDEMRHLLVTAAGLPSDAIRSLTRALANVEITIEAFGERAGEAAQVKGQTLKTLAEMATIAEGAESEKARLVAERAELTRLRAEQEARDKAERERIAAEQQAAADKLDAERKAFEQEQAAARAEAQKREARHCARRDEEDRLAREARAAEDKRLADAREALEAEQRAIRRAEEAKLVEARRVEQEAADQAAAAERKRLDDEAAERRAEAERLAKAALAEVAAHKRVRDAAHDMLDALCQWKHAESTGDAEELENARTSRDAAIALATGDAS